MKNIRPILHSSWLDSPLGPMLAMANENALYLLEFRERRGIERELTKLRKEHEIIEGSNSIIASIKNELKAYCDGTLSEFKTPIKILGTPFQIQVWDALLKIPFGETRSYLEQASVIAKPSACRAVANANGANQLAIIIPCHRIINHNGGLGGYGGGLSKKSWLLEHEKKSKAEQKA